MAWSDSAIPFLRVLINDLGGSPTYKNCRLEELLVMAAHLVKQELYFPITYTVSIPGLTISPDPETDEIFINFIVLKAACLVDQSTYRTKAALEGLTASVGPASLSVGGHLVGFKYLLENGCCKMYQELKDQYRTNQCLAYTVQAVLTPFVSSVFNPIDSLGGGGETQHRSHHTYNDNNI